MNSLKSHSITSSDDKSHSEEKHAFFPNADESISGVRKELQKKINSGKSELGNYILAEIQIFRDTGKDIEIDLSKVSSTFSERSEIRRILYNQGWKIVHHVQKTTVTDLIYIEASFDEIMMWKISQREKQ
jgi:hypothetical protein